MELPAFASEVATAMAQVSAANTNRDGTGTIATILSAPAVRGTAATATTPPTPDYSPGTLVVNRVRVVAVGTTTAGMVRLYLHDGTNFRLLDEIPVTAITPSGTVAAFQAEKSYSDLIIPTGWSLRASTHNAETFNVFAFGGRF